METSLLIKRYQIFVTVIVLSATLPVISLPFIGNAWAQERGLVIPEPADVPPPANATNSSTIMKDNINASSPDTAVNNTIEVPSDIPNATLESESPQSNNTNTIEVPSDIPNATLESESPQSNNTNNNKR